MAKLTASTIATALNGKIEFNDNLELIEAPIVEVWREHLPEGLTEDLVKDVSNYRKTFLDGYVQAAGNAIADKVKEIPAIESLSAVTNTADVGFEVHFTRPQGEEPTKKDYEAAWGFGYKVPFSASIEKSRRKELASRFFDEAE